MGPPTSGIPGFTAGRKGRAPSRETSHASICPGHELFVGHSWGEGGGTLHDSRLAGGARRPDGVAWTRLVLRALGAAPGTARRCAPLGAGVVFRRAVRRMSCNRKPIREGARPHHDAVLERRATSDRPARGAAAGNPLARRRPFGVHRGRRACRVRGAPYAGWRVDAPRAHLGAGGTGRGGRRAHSSRDGHPRRPRRPSPPLHRRHARGVLPGRGATAVSDRPRRYGRPGAAKLRARLSTLRDSGATRRARSTRSRGVRRRRRSRCGPAVLPYDEGADAGRVLHVGDWRHARAAPRAGAGPVRGVRPARSDRPGVGGVIESYDAIVVGSGITGGWAAKELCENGLRTLVLERGRHVEQGKDYITEWWQPWQFAHRGRGDQQLYERDYPIQSKNYAFGEATRHFFVNDREHPYVTPEGKPFRSIRRYQLGGRSLIWGRLCWRWSDLDFGANLRDGHGVDWPIRYKDLAPWYAYVERFVGVSGERLGLPHLPDGEFLRPWELNCAEHVVKRGIERAFPGRHMTITRVANLTEPHNGRGRCQARNQCARGCTYGGYFSSLSATLPAAQKTGKLTVVTDAPGLGVELKQRLREPGPWGISLQGYGECLPRHENYVDLDPERTDQWGIPLPRVHCSWSENERAIREDVKTQAAEMLEAAGCTNVETYDEDGPPGFSVHEMGTARMGRDPKTAVLNAHNQAHDVPNLFVTDGACMTSSSCVNPSLTYMALTARAVDFAVSELKRRNL